MVILQLLPAIVAGIGNSLNWNKVWVQAKKSKANTSEVKNNMTKKRTNRKPPAIKHIGGVPFRYKKTVSTRDAADAWMKKEKTPKRLKTTVRGVKMWSTSIPKCRIVKTVDGKYHCYSTKKN